MAGLGEVLERAIDCEREIRRRDAVRPKLTGEAFVREALKLAGAKRADADGLLKKLEDRAVTPAASAALTRCRRHVMGETLPNGIRVGPSQPHRRIVTMVGDDAAAELAALSASPQLLFAATAVSLIDDDVWGTCDTVAELGAYGADLRHERDRLHAELAEVVTLTDLNLDFRSLTPTERDAGLIRASFKIAPNVHLGEGWPGRLVDHLLACRSAEAA